MTIAVRNLRAFLPDGDDLKHAMQRLASGVVIITAGQGSARVGLTATSAVSLSVDPPTMLICVNRSSSSLPVIARNRHFCVNILAAHQQEIAARFAGMGAVHGAARYEGLSWRKMATGTSALSDAQANIDCTVDEIIERHTHAIILGAVRAVRVNPVDDGALVYRRSGFHGISG